MKFRITFKDPDGVENSLYESVSQDLASIPNLDDNERELLKESRIQKLKDIISKWINYGELIQIEFDTETNTATVIEI